MRMFTSLLLNMLIRIMYVYCLAREKEIRTSRLKMKSEKRFRFRTAWDFYIEICINNCISIHIYIYIYFVSSKYLKSERDMNEDIKRKEETVIGDWRNQCGPSRSTIVVFSRGRRRS